MWTLCYNQNNPLNFLIVIQSENAEKNEAGKAV
jgi:hypothetical protein